MQRWLGEQRQDLLDFKSSDRPWTLVMCAALSACFPLFVGAHFQRMDFGLMASLGGMVFLSMPNAPLLQRLMVLMAASFGMVSSYALGALSQFWPAAMVPAFALIATVVTLVARAYRLGPPGALFFIMAAAIAAYTPATIDDVPLRVGVVAMGGLWACVVGLVYSIYSRRRFGP